MAVIAATACSSGSPSAGPTAAPTFAVTDAEVQSVNQPAPTLPDDVRTMVVATLDSYVDRAMVGPLRSGERAGDLGSLFTAPAAARVDGPDRAAMIDEGMSKASGVQGLASTARLGALAGPDGDIAVVTATIDLRLQTTGDDPLTIARTGDLVLVADGGAWKIDGYDLSTTRDSGTGPVTTTARG